MPIADILAPFQLAAEQAGIRETAYRKEAEQHIASLERERAHAWRRLNMLAAMQAAGAGEEPEQAIEAKVRAGLRFMELIEVALDELDAAGHEVHTRFVPIARALHDAGPDERGAAVAEALAGFETWHQQRFGRAFWDQLERPVSFAPVVDF